MQKQILTQALPFILDVIKKQGVSFMLLGIAVWHLTGEIKELKQDNLNCETKVIQVLETLVVSTNETNQKAIIVLERVDKKLD